VAIITHFKTMLGVPNNRRSDFTAVMVC